MLIKIPNHKEITLKNIVFDFNGTLAETGEVSHDTFLKLKSLTKDFNVFVVTADTFNTAKETFKDTDVQVKIISNNEGTKDKGDFVSDLGSQKTIAVGNGNNDYLMLEKAIIGCSILGPEGLSKEALLVSDLFLSSIDDFFKLTKTPEKIIATLRK